MARNRAATGGRAAAVANASDKRRTPVSEMTGTSASQGVPKMPLVFAPASVAVPAVLRESPSAPTAEAPGRMPASPPVAVEVTLIRGGHSNVEAPVAVGARYEGLALVGAAKVFDRG